MLFFFKHRKVDLGHHVCTLTSTNCLQRVEKGHKQVHEHSQVEGDAAPEGHVSGAPVEDGLSCVMADQSKRIQITALQTNPIRSNAKIYNQTQLSLLDRSSNRDTQGSERRECVCVCV